jgi:polyhydroxyalkanoate synthesis regulator phasin
MGVNGSVGGAVKELTSKNPALGAVVIIVVLFLSFMVYLLRTAQPIASELNATLRANTRILGVAVHVMEPIKEDVKELTDLLDGEKLRGAASRAEVDALREDVNALSRAVGDLR